MKMVKVVLLAGISTALTSSLTFAVPIDVTITGGAPFHDWGESALLDPGFQDVVPVVNAPSSINLAGADSITVNWNAPAGFMYVVNPPPAGLAGGGAELFFSIAYGPVGQTASLGSITGSSFSVHTVFGTSPLSEQTIFNQPGLPALAFTASGSMSPNSAPFAFTSISVSVDFSDTGVSQTLDRTGLGPPTEGFGVLTGDFAINGNGPEGVTYFVPPDPGALITLEPLPNGSVPDDSPTLVLAGFGLAGLLFVGRKKFASVPVSAA